MILFSLKVVLVKMANRFKQHKNLTPKRPRPFFDPFLKFGQAIVNAIFVQKISNFQ
jgi:hypothetical protein